jgi:hypothetical protein
MEKDLRQAVLAAKYVLSEKAEREKLARLWDTFPRGWKSRVRSALTTAQDLFPLEQGDIQSLQKVLV